MKVTKRVYPSPILEIDEVTYYLKAVVEHSGGPEGGLDSGHYTTALNMETLWVICDDSSEFKITEVTPIDGYLFFYETSPLKLSKELVNTLSAASAVQREIFSSFVNRPMDEISTAQKAAQDLDPKDLSIELDMSRDEIIEKLQSLNVSVVKGQTTARYKEILKNKLKSDHPINQMLRNLDASKLKSIACKIKVKYDAHRSQMFTKIANYFFRTHPNSPLTSLKKCMNAPNVEGNKAEINKNHPIFEFLQNVPDDEVRNYTKKLGKNNLRNFNSMRSYLCDYFFNHDKDAPLESFQKIIKGELPELDVTLKKDSNKRKSELRPGLKTKKSKTDSKVIDENQEKLKKCRQTFLDSITKKQGLGNHLVDNPIIDKVTKFKETMSNWNREDPCKICHESWFDQDNATSGKYIGVCQRCRNYKDKEIPMFSQLNEMIPGPSLCNHV